MSDALKDVILSIVETLSEVQRAIEKLPRKDLEQLFQWLRERAADTWDDEIEHDARAGLLDPLVAETDAAIEAGRVAEMP